MIYSKLKDGTIFCHTNKKMYRNYEEFAKDGLYELQQKVEQLENIRKEIKEYIEGFYDPDERQLTHEFDGWNLAKLYDILSRGDINEK